MCELSSIAFHPDCLPPNCIKNLSFYSLLQYWVKLILFFLTVSALQPSFISHFLTGMNKISLILEECCLVFKLGKVEKAHCLGNRTNQPRVMNVQYLYVHPNVRVTYIRLSTQAHPLNLPPLSFFFFFFFIRLWC